MSATPRTAAERKRQESTPVSHEKAYLCNVDIFVFCETLECELVEMTKKRDALHLMSLLPPSELCRRHQVQNCGVCDRMECCDNTSPAKKRVADLEREACNMARAMIRNCRHFRTLCAESGCLRCSDLSNKSCAGRKWLADHGDETAWEVKP